MSAAVALPLAPERRGPGRPSKGLRDQTKARLLREKKRAFFGALQKKGLTFTDVVDQVADAVIQAVEGGRTAVVLTLSPGNPSAVALEAPPKTQVTSSPEAQEILGKSDTYGEDVASATEMIPENIPSCAAQIGAAEDALPAVEEGPPSADPEIMPSPQIPEEPAPEEATPEALEESEATALPEEEAVPPALSSAALSTQAQKTRPGCAEPGCPRPAALTYQEKRYCLIHGGLLQEVERIITEPLETPPVALAEASPPPDCLTCRNRRFLPKEEGGQVIVERCPDCDVPCQRCEGTGFYFYARGGYEGQEACACRRHGIGQAKTLFDAAQIPGAYVNLLGELPPRPLSPEQKEAHARAEAWRKSYLAGNHRQGLFFYGPPGTGKTLSLSRQLAGLSIRCGVRCKYVHWPSYLDTRKQMFGGKELEADCVQELVGVEVLLVDEILLRDRRGKKRSFSDWERSQFDLLIHGRHNATRPTLFATNYSPEDIEDEVAESTWSRIRSTSTFLEVTGPDLRQKRRR